MCTISWEFFPCTESIASRESSLNHNGDNMRAGAEKSIPMGYRVYFNRDEQKTRPRAALPSEFLTKGVRFICPIDPQGGGTWCATNEYGFTFALLNFYQGRFPKGKLRSRGELVKNAAQFNRVEHVEQYLASVDLNKYPPFSFLIFSPFSTSVSLLRWTGKSLEASIQESPLISSAKYFERVRESRLNLYQATLYRDGEYTPTKSDFIALHKSHEPERSAYSMCMHRDEAQTVSFSCVEVAGECAEYWYSDGPPCEAPLGKVASLRLANA